MVSVEVKVLKATVYTREGAINIERGGGGR